MLLEAIPLEKINLLLACQLLFGFCRESVLGFYDFNYRELTVCFCSLTEESVLNHLTTSILHF